MRILHALVITAALAVGASSSRAEPPNLVLFIVDDLGWQDTSIAMDPRRSPAHRLYRTPSVERLAQRGVRFTHGYAAAPVCTPTRAAILTGESPARSHVTYWTLQRDIDTSVAHPTLRPPAWRVNGVQPADVTLARRLRDAGYHTIHVGKAHWGAHDTPGGDPLRLGFDVNIAGHASGAPASYLGTQNFSQAGRTGRGGASVWDVPGLEAWHGRDIYLTEALAIEAVMALEDAVARGRPFFINFATYAVHAPIMANAKYLDTYTELDDREAAYATMIESYDAALGAVLDALDRLGVADRTVVVFTSDNGGLSAHARGGAPHVHNAPLRSGKGSAYEGGTRVPWIIAGPGIVAPGTTCDVPVVSTDLFPTFLHLAGAAAPNDRSGDGRDLTPLLSGDAASFDAERTIGWHQPHQWGASGPGIEPYTAIRRGAWKLIWFHASGRSELYDVVEDVGETHDCAAERPEVLRAMQEAMAAWIADTGAQLSVDKASGEVVSPPRP